MFRKRIPRHNQKMDYHNLNPNYNRPPPINLRLTFKKPGELFKCPGRFGIDTDDFNECLACGGYDKCAEESEKHCSVGGKFGVDTDTLLFCDTCDIRELCLKDKATI